MSPPLVMPLSVITRLEMLSALLSGKSGAHHPIHGRRDDGVSLSKTAISSVPKSTTISGVPYRASWRLTCSRSRVQPPGPRWAPLLLYPAPVGPSVLIEGAMIDQLGLLQLADVHGAHRPHAGADGAHSTARPRARYDVDQPPVICA